MTGTNADIVQGVATTGKALRGTATTGYGLYASVTSGQAVYAESTGTGGSAINGTAANGIGGYFLNNATGFATLYVTNNGSGNLASFSNSAGTKFTINNAGNLGNGTYTYTLPSATGTLALTSALTGYLPLTGGTLTGALSGTSATFSGLLTSTLGNNTVLYNAVSATTGYQYANIQSGNARLIFGIEAATSAGIFTDTLGNSAAIGSASATGAFHIASNSIVRQTVFSGGNIGIGTTTDAGYKLDVSGTGRFTSNLTLGSGATLYMTAGDIQFVSNAGYGILTADSNRLISIQNGAFGVNGAATFSSAAGITNGNGLNLRAGGNSASDANVLNFTSLAGTINVSMFSDALNSNTRLKSLGNLSFHTGNIAISADNERVTILSTGNVGIGTTSPGNLLTIKDKSQIGFRDETSNSTREALSNYAYTPTYGDGLKIGNGYNVVSISGNVGIGTASPSYQLQLSTDSAAKPSTNTWTIASDSRVKENITPYTKGLSAIMAINPVNYDYNGKAGFGNIKNNIGVIAQDVLEILPESVSTYKAKLEESDEEDTELYNFNSHALTYILINAIKELKAEIDLLKGIAPIEPTDNNLE
jgi:trimeric autotransporter adhesin